MQHVYLMVVSQLNLRRAAREKSRNDPAELLRLVARRGRSKHTQIVTNGF